MTENLSATDAYARASRARVLETDGAAVLVDRTVVYPGGGGQPADHAWLRAPDGNRWAVTSVRKDGSKLWHELEHAEAGMPAVGDAVEIELDWERRHRLMRTHSALHVLCGVVWRDHGALVTGGNMEPLVGRMDFEFETMSGDLVSEIEARVNEEIAADREIRVAMLPRDEAFAIPDLIRTKINLLPPGIERSARSRSWASTSRPMVAPTWRAPPRSGTCASPATRARAGSTSGSGSPSRTPEPWRLRVAPEEPRPTPPG